MAEFTRADDLGITRDPVCSRCGEYYDETEGPVDIDGSGVCAMCRRGAAALSAADQDDDDWTDDEDSYDEDDWREHEDEKRANRGTSQCDQLCDPTCNWCLVGHDCPDQCGGGDDCPYEVLAREEAQRAGVPRG